MAGETELCTQITRKLNENKYECMVCISRIERTDAIWACGRCFSLLHLDCGHAWATKCVDGQGLWQCPACRNQASKLPENLCFCGKKPDPESSPYQTPHSCGDTCQRLRVGTPCTHPCTLQCHPGPCPPCAQRSPTKTCHCGKQSYVTACSDVDPGRSCREACGRALSCGRHRCSRECHAGACGVCPITERQTCHCGKETTERRCGTGTPTGQGSWSYSCGTACQHKLGCGNHSCVKVCHTGACAPCELAPEVVRGCPCGKKALAELGVATRTSCLDPVPTCGAPCGKARELCAHPCAAPCHTGPCPPCVEPVTVKCRCKLSTPALPCHEVKLAIAAVMWRHLNPDPDARDPAEAVRYASAREWPVSCTRRCGKLRSCGKHECGADCCPHASNDATGANAPAAHKCPLKCNKLLSCGKHICPFECHPGHCAPCMEVNFSERPCPCGKTVVDPPIECGQAMPVCPYACSVARPCGHPANHSCHFDGPCTPCVTLVSRMCGGHHEMRHHVPCHISNVSCGRPCNQELPCRRHRCRRPCHVGPCQLASVNATAESCRGACGRERRCGHSCQADCHDGPCPETRCDAEMELSCSCGTLAQITTCGYPRAGWQSRAAEPECGPQCEGTDHRASRGAGAGAGAGARKPQLPKISYARSGALTNPFPVREDPPRPCIQFIDIPDTITSAAVIGQLEPFKSDFKLHWLNESTCLAMFFKDAPCTAALEYLKGDATVEPARQPCPYAYLTWTQYGPLVPYTRKEPTAANAFDALQDTVATSTADEDPVDIPEGSTTFQNFLVSAATAAAAPEPEEERLPDSAYFVEQDEDKRKIANTNRCAGPKCKKPTDMTGFPCGFCNRTYCITHMLPESHGCTKQASVKSKEVFRKEANDAIREQKRSGKSAPEPKRKDTREELQAKLRAKTQRPGAKKAGGKK